MRVPLEKSLGLGTPSLSAELPASVITEKEI